jgi:hypothetical protein
VTDVSGEVITIAPRIQLDLSGLDTGEEETVVLARAVDVEQFDEATLQVAVIREGQSDASPQFFVEVRTVEPQDGDVQDALGDVIAQVALDSTSTGRLVLAAIPAGFGSKLQVSVRGVQVFGGRELVLLASVGLVVRADDRLRRDLEADFLDFRSEIEAGFANVARLRERYQDATWLDDAAATLAGLRAALRVARASVPVGCCARPRPLPDDVVWFRYPGQSRAREITGRRLVGSSCGGGACCDEVTLDLSITAPFPQTVTAQARICYPSVSRSKKPSALLILTHGALEGGSPDDIFDPSKSGSYLGLLSALAAAGIVAALVSKAGGLYVNEFPAALESIKQWIFERVVEEPEHPLAQLDLADLRVAFGGHSQGGRAAIDAASVAQGVPVRAVVCLASGSPESPVELHPGTHLISILGTHDLSPSIGVADPVRVIERVFTDAPRVLVVLPGAAHDHLGPSGSAFGDLGPSEATEADFAFARAQRNFAVTRFLQWALLGDYEAARDAFTEPRTTVVFNEEPGDFVSGGWWGPGFCGALVRVPTAALPLAPFEESTAFNGSDGALFQASEGFADDVVIQSLAETFAAPAISGLRDCTGADAAPGPVESYHEATAVAVVRFDCDIGSDGQAIVRTELESSLAEILGAIQDPEDFCLKVDLALRVNAQSTAEHQLSWGETQWWPGLGLGTSAGPQLWIRPRAVLVGWGFGCVLKLSDPLLPDRRPTTLTSVCARVPLLVPLGVDGVTHAFVNLKSPYYWWRGEAVIASISIVNQG